MLTATPLSAPFLPAQAAKQHFGDTVTYKLEDTIRG